MNVEKESISDKMNSNTEKSPKKEAMLMPLKLMMFHQIPKQPRLKLKQMKPLKLKLKPKLRKNLLNLTVMEKKNQKQKTPSTVVILMKPTSTPNLTLKMQPLKPKLNMLWKKRLKLMKKEKNQVQVKRKNHLPVMKKEKAVVKKSDLAMPRI